MTDTTTSAPPREDLEAERDFLLRSLDDLETERAAGGIDDESYQALHDDYTARAAAVIRALRDGVDARPTAAPIPWRRRALVVGGIVVVAIGAGVALASSLGTRLPGQTSSGNTGTRAPQEDSVESRRKELEDRVAEHPEDVGSRLLLARFLEADSDIAGALEQYDAVIGIDATNAQAYAHSGRLLYITAQAAPDQAAELVDRSRARLDQAIELDPEFADARYFRAILLANEYGDFTRAQGDLQRYLVLSPNGEFAEQARQLLADVTRALESPTTTSP
jgi:cytochrome c-type biogenesis protein CcmH